MKVFVKGLHGCSMRKTNITQYVDFLKANGHEIVENPHESDTILLWSCAFRGDFRDNSISEITRYQKEFKAELIVVGCLPDIDRALLEQNFSGRFINWRNDEEQLEKYFGVTYKKLSDIPRKLGEAPLADDIAQFKKENPDKDAQFADQFIKLFVAEGCKFRCSYCAEILAFPPYRSFPENDLVAECKRLVEETNRNEVMLLGDSVGDYGVDIGTTLPHLIRRLRLVLPKIKIALQGYNPANFIRYFDDMKEFLQKDWILHMQLPIQSASPSILGLMNRPYTREHLNRVFSLLNEIKFREFDTHIIVGFPGETESDLEATVQFILRHRPKYVLASQYMESPTMPSAQLPNKVDSETKSRRLHEAARRIRKEGILCNYDDSELSVCRFRSLNMY